MGNALRPYPSLNERKKNILTTFFLYIFISVAIAFIILTVAKKDYDFLLADAAFLVLSLGLFYFLRVKNRLSEVIVIFVVLICSISTLFILTGGIQNTGILTAILIPIPIILLLGKKRGLWILLAFFLLNSGGFILLKNSGLHPNYSSEWLGRVIGGFVIISLITYVNEFVFDQLYLRLESITNSFKISQERYKNLAINREKFVSLVSHDLSGHISNFASVSNTLNQQYDELGDKEKKKLVSQMAIISEQNSKLLHDLLKWSTVLNETIPYSPKPIKLERIYREVIELFDPVIEDKKLSVFLKMKSNAQIFADYDMLGSILRNLVSNAIKYSEHGGEIRINAEERENLMFISVLDKGVGISSEDLQRLHSFVSFSNPGTLKESGMGIGLILTKEFIQKNRGEFFIESKPGEGTEASFTVPLAE